jgi:hypothetical protein
VTTPIGPPGAPSGGCCATPPMSPCGQVCVSTTGCGSRTVNGSSVTLKLGGVGVGTALTGSSVATIVMTNTGSGYNSSNPPNVTFGGAGGAAGSPVVSATGHVTAITIVLSGNGYTVAPSVTIDAPAQITAVPGIVDLIGGTIAIPLVNGGQGYLAAPAVTLTGGTFTTPATATAIMGSGATSGMVVSIHIIGGTGYTVAPAVMIAAPAGAVTATATTTLGTNVCFAIYSTGTYTISATAPAKAWWDSGVVSGSTNITVCSGTHAVSVALVPHSGYGCHCSNCTDPVPDTLYITDSNGTWTAPWTGSTWSVCYTSGGAIETCNPLSPFPNRCSGAGAGGDYAVSYTISCPVGGPPNHYQLTMSATACNNGAGAWQPSAGSCSGTLAVSTDANCGTGGAASEPGGPYYDTGAGNWAPSNCNTGGGLSLAFSMTDFTGLMSGPVTVTH